jgi:Uma2 family endonuclease
MTAQELIEYSHEPYQQELIDGILHEMEPPGALHGEVAARIGLDLMLHVRADGLGIVFTSEVGFRLTTDPDTVRGPDVAFVCRERATATGMPKGYWPGPPDLAIEVVSQHDRRAKVETKAREWIAAGTRAVIVADPPSRTVTVYLGPDDVRRLHGDERLDLGDVVAGWSPRVADFFV